MEKVKIPINLESEAAVLGAAMRSADSATELTQKLKITDFFDAKNREIFAKINDLVLSDHPVTFERIVHLVPKETVPLAYLVDLHHIGSVVYDLHENLEKVKEASVKRRIQEISVRGQLKAGGEEKAEEVVKSIETELFSLTQETGKKTLLPFVEIINAPKKFDVALQERVAKFESGENTFEGVPTGYIDLDRMIRGFLPGHLTVIGARPGCGKTSLALNLTEKICLNNKMPVLFFSLEMPAKELCEKLLCQSAGTSHREFMQGKISRANVDFLIQVEKSWSSRSLIIEDQPSLTIDQIKARSVRAKRVYGIQAIFIDYVQLVRSPGKEARHLEIADISRRLKEISKELEVPIIALAQLNRESEKRDSKRPVVSDLRESGQLEADADEILLLHRPELYDAHDSPGVLEVNIAKNRFGPTGTIKLAFNTSIGSIENLAYNFK